MFSGDYSFWHTIFPRKVALMTSGNNCTCFSVKQHEITTEKASCLICRWLQVLQFCHAARRNPRIIFAGARAVVKQLKESSIRLKDDALNIGRASIFWLVVLVAALYIIDYQ